MNDYRELLIGCGSRREKDIQRFLREHPELLMQQPILKQLIGEWSGLVTLDIREECNPDFVCDLFNGMRLQKISPDINLKDVIDWDGDRHHFIDNSFNELHAYEVLEHVGSQGDYRTFFKQFTEYHRILKPDGLFCATCPSWQSMWAWGDPSHTRVITSGSLVFLSQAEYEKQVGKTAMSDFRHLYKADFEPMFVFEDQNTLAFVLRAIK